MVLGAEVAVAGLPLSNTGAGDQGNNESAKAGGSSGWPAVLPAAVVAETAVELGGQLFTVGNPSNVDLESLGQGSTSPALRLPSRH